MFILQVDVSLESIDQDGNSLLVVPIAELSHASKVEHGVSVIVQGPVVRTTVDKEHDDMDLKEGGRRREKEGG